MERLESIPLADLLERIRRAREMDVNKIDPEAIRTRIGRIMHGYHTVEIKVATNGLFRARKNTGDAPFLRVSDLWYPPASAVRFRGRFNEAGSPVFYASNRWNGAVFEVRPKVGDVITVLVASSKKPMVELTSAHIGLERSKAPELGKAERRKMLQHNPSFQEMLRHYGIGKKWLAIDEFLSDMATGLFTPGEEQGKYIITNAISDRLFRIPGIQALNYPSVATNLHCLNICLPPNVADEHFTATEAWMIRVVASTNTLPGVDKNGLYYGTKFIRKSEAIDTNGGIRWSAPLLNVQPRDVAHLIFRSPFVPTGAF